MVLKKEEEKKNLEEICQELINQNAKLNKQVVGQMALQGDRHMIWDEIIKEASRFRLYLDYVVDHENALMSSRKNVVVVKHALNKKPMQGVQNVVDFFSTLSEDRIKRMGIQDKFFVVSWAKRVIGKYRKMETM